ncbi:MAG TPA: hypothetical protein VJQ56_02355 [Blastocatellia bacterium]|nr:hypothetical protein [Blastocatellia bacterium]
MIRKFLALLIVSLLTQAAVCVDTASGNVKPGKQSRSSEKVRLGVSKLGVGPESRVEVRLRDRSKLTGYIQEIKDDSFVVAEATTGTHVFVAYGNVAQVKGQNLSTGAKIAIGIAIGAGIALIILAIYIKCCTG